jgi:hypothetical protein
MLELDGSEAFEPKTNLKYDWALTYRQARLLPLLKFHGPIFLTPDIILRLLIDRGIHLVLLFVFKSREGGP